MSARDLDPAVWAAAYAAEYRGRHEAGRLAGVDALTRHAPACGIDLDRCREIADAAVLALHPEARGETPETAKARDAAWARLVKAVETRWREDIQGAAQVDYLREIDAAKDALRALGVGEDLLRLGEQ